jgi:crossover junction endodeoxyribonuclease RuvC
MNVVIGIDPGAAHVGFGVVRGNGSSMVALDGGVIETPSTLPIERRLEQIYEAIGDLITWHRPRSLAIERIYFGRNAKSAMAVGQASGVVLLAAAEHGVDCFEYTPQAIKMAVCGSGGADKIQVQRMVATLLGLPEPPASDHAADAFGAAICHGTGRSVVEALPSKSENRVAVEDRT